MRVLFNMNLQQLHSTKIHLQYVSALYRVVFSLQFLTMVLNYTFAYIFFQQITDQFELCFFCLLPFVQMPSLQHAHHRFSLKLYFTLKLFLCYLLGDRRSCTVKVLKCVSLLCFFQMQQCDELPKLYHKQPVLISPYGLLQTICFL